MTGFLEIAIFYLFNFFLIFILFLSFYFYNLHTAFQDHDHGAKWR